MQQNIYSVIISIFKNKILLKIKCDACSRYMSSFLCYHFFLAGDEDAEILGDLRIEEPLGRSFLLSVDLWLCCDVERDFGLALLAGDDVGRLCEIDVDLVGNINCDGPPFFLFGDTPSVDGKVVDLRVRTTEAGTFVVNFGACLRPDFLVMGRFPIIDGILFWAALSLAVDAVDVAVDDRRWSGFIISMEVRSTTSA